MARYDVYANPSGSYVLDVQADLLDDLKTRVVIPLLIRTLAPIPAKRLNPSFEIEGVDHILVTQFMVAIPASTLKKPVMNLSSSHDEIITALDMVFRGF